MGRLGAARLETSFGKVRMVCEAIDGERKRDGLFGG